MGLTRYTCEIVPKHPVRKAADNVLYPSRDKKESKIVELTLAQVQQAFKTSDVALVVKNVSYKVLPTNLEEQAGLVDMGKAPTVEAGDIGIKSLASYFSIPDENEAVKGKAVGELQTKVDLTDGNVYGTLNFVKGYTEFDADEAKQSGYFFAFKYTKNDVYTDVKIQPAWDSTDPVDVAEGLNVVRLADKKDLASTRVFKITATKGEEAETDFIRFLNANFGDEDVTVTFESGVAEAAGKKYQTLQAAIDENAGNIKLLMDVAEDIVINKGAKVTLDLNGHLLTNVSSHTIDNNGTLLLSNGSLDNISHAKAPFANEVYATASLTNVTLARSDDYAKHTYYTLLNHGDLTLTRCTLSLVAKDNIQHSSLIDNGWYNGKQKPADAPVASLIANDTTFIGGMNTIKNDDYSKLVLNSGKVLANQPDTQGAFLNYGDMTINDVDVEVYGPDGDKNGFYFCNNFLDEKADPGILLVKGGRFKGYNQAEAFKTWDDSKGPGDRTIVGGNFDKRVPDDWLGEGFTWDEKTHDVRKMTDAELAAYEAKKKAEAEEAAKKEEEEKKDITDATVTTPATTEKKAAPKKVAETPAPVATTTEEKKEEAPAAK